MVSRRVQRRRWRVLVHLWAVASHHFPYPPLEQSHWYLPRVVRWGAWYPSVTPSSRSERRLVGKPVMPELIYFARPVLPPSQDTRRLRFELHLQHETGVRWIVHWDHVENGWLPVELVTDTLTLTDDGREYHTIHRRSVPALSYRRRLMREIGGALFERQREGESRELVTYEKTDK
jgi:hypothetical protein